MRKLGDIYFQHNLLTFQGLLIVSYNNNKHIAKWYAWELNMKALDFIYDYLTNHEKEVNWTMYVARGRIYKWSSSEPILRSMLFNVDPSDLFLQKELPLICLLFLSNKFITNYADANTPDDSWEKTLMKLLHF